MAVSTKLLDRIRKLLALAGSANEHEAALAAAHAQRLLAAHNLALADLDADQPCGTARFKPVAAAATPEKWWLALAGNVAAACDCKFVVGGGRAYFVGTGADPQVAGYLFAYLARTVRELAAAWRRAPAQARLRPALRQSAATAYRLGLVKGVSRTLRRQRTRTPVTPGALVLHKQRAIDQALLTAFGDRVRAGECRASRVDGRAFRQGETAGRAVRLHQGLTTKPAGRPAGPLPAPATPDHQDLVDN